MSRPGPRPDIGPGLRPRLGLILVVFCTVVTLGGRNSVLCSTAPNGSGSEEGSTSWYDSGTGTDSTSYESGTEEDSTPWYDSGTGTDSTPYESDTDESNNTTYESDTDAGGTTWYDSNTGTEDTTWSESDTGTEDTTWSESDTGTEDTTWSESDTGTEYTTWSESDTGTEYTTSSESDTGTEDTTWSESDTDSSSAPPAVITDSQCDSTSSGECEAMFGPTVVCGTSGFCVCASEDHVPMGDRCRHKCVAEARQLHDNARRTKKYKNAIGEPVVTDHKITEGWYSLDQYRLMGATSQDLTEGSCGARYQIVLKDGATVDWDTLDLNEVSLTATVYGRPVGHTEDLEIRVRKCENATQYYLKPPTVRLAAYCFDSMDDDSSPEDEDPLTIPIYQNYVWIQASLHFREELRGNGLFDVPYVIWTCHVENYLNQIKSIPEIQFISLSWFANNVRIQSTEPQPISDVIYDVDNGGWAAANLTEDDLLGAGYSLGVVIRCGVQVSRSGAGKLSSMSTTSFNTNLFSSGGSSTAGGMWGISVNNDKNIITTYNDVPLGCAAPVGAPEENCTLKFHVIRDDGSMVCSDSLAEAEEHELCGLTVFGLTKNGSERHNAWDLIQPHYNNENGTYVTENIGTFIQLKSTSGEMESGAGVYFSLAVWDNTAGHPLWDNYEIHNAEIYVSDGKSQDSGYHSCSIGQGYTGLRIEMNGWDPSNPMEAYEQLPVVEAGKYIMLWSGRFPFIFEVEIESTVDGVLYVCGAYVRYGNDIYGYSVCGGVFMEGLIFGDGHYLPEIFTSSYISLEEAGVTMNSYINEGQLSISFESNSYFEAEFEGFCAFGHNGMIGRNGNTYTNNSAEFLRTWRIDYAESLTNPENQLYYTLESKYSTCGCPAKTDDISERDVVYESQWGISENVYTGALHCNLDEVCTDMTVGEDWPVSLRPDYLIEDVEVVCEQVTESTGDSVLRFTCQFHSVPDKLYTVVWYIDNVVFLERKEVPPAATDVFTITDDEIYQTYGDDFFFDMKIQCSASVLDSSSNVLIAPVLSEELVPIHFGSTFITIQRGGDGTIIWTNYIPFLCTGGHTSCEMELQFYDPNDSYDCEDSTIAIKSEDNCGGKVRATNTAPAVTGTDTTTIITTKNNDKYELKTGFELRAVVIFHGAGRSYWTQILRTVFSVVIVDEVYWVGQSCHLHVDPHARNMDGRYYEMQHVGMFQFLLHITLPIEIQTVTMPCWTGWGSWSPTCSCAIIIRAGADIWLINHCDNNHITGFLSAGNRIIEVFERGDTWYQVVLPNTMMVDIYVMPYFGYFMNIDVYPSPLEKHNIVGLCGNFNGDFNDDFQIRDTSNQGSTDEFSLSWELLETGRWLSESLLEEANYQNPTPWNVDEKLCVCPDAANAATVQSLPLCSVNEEQTCTKSKSHKGKKLNTETRPKRDTGGHINLDIEKRVHRLKEFIFEQHTIHRKKRGAVSNTNAMNETEARRLCEEQFAACAVNNIDGKPIQEDKYLEDCISDLMASGNVEWAGPHCTALTTRCEAALAKDVAYAQNNTQVVSAMEQICTGNCNGHGTCIGNDVCQCEPGWGRKQCTLDLTVLPMISYITGGGRCDYKEDICQEFIIETGGLAEFCHAKVAVLEAKADGIFFLTDEFISEVESLSYNEAVVDVTTGRRRRATSTDPVLANQYGVSISNDGVNFGNATYVTVLDTRCQETINNSNGDTVVVLMAAFCYIDGVCYGEGNTSAASSCQICRTAVNLFDWTEENCPTTASTTASPTEDDNLPLYIIIFPVLGGVVVIIFISGLLFLRYIHKKRPVSPLQEAPPYTRGPVPEGPMNLRFYLKEVGVSVEPEKGLKKKF